jgi:MSHA biogenesis protein MshP
MYPDRSLMQQKGAGLPLAIFIITVLALLVAGMSQLQESSGKSVSLQIQSQRAFYAAESGAQGGVAEVLEAGDCGALTSPKVFSGSGLNSCEAELTCESVDADIDRGPDPERVFSIASTGSCGGGADFAERTIEVRVR